MPFWSHRLIKFNWVEPLPKANSAGIPVMAVDIFIGSGVYQTGAGNADFLFSYVASDNILGGRMAARALAFGDW
jgi:ribose transport system substrate-binding protein